VIDRPILPLKKEKFGKVKDPFGRSLGRVSLTVLVLIPCEGFYTKATVKLQSKK
jgi:hypothetical protein